MKLFSKKPQLSEKNKYQYSLLEPALVRELTVNGRKVTCHITYKKIRHAYLRMKPDYQLEINLPANNRFNAEEILKEKQHWIEKKVKELSRMKPVFQNGHVLFQGEYRELRFIPTDKPSKTIQVDDHAIAVYGKSQDIMRKSLTSFLAGQTQHYVSQKAAEFARELGVTCHSIATKQTRTWGYCTRQGAIFFNWKLICLPLNLVDFIICHELLHLKHFNHSKRFKNALAKQFPESKELDRKLKTYTAH